MKYLINIVDLYRRKFCNDHNILVFHCFPNKTTIFKGDKCKEGKKSNLRETIFLAANQNRTEKISPFMFGCLTKPKCFSKMKSFPFVYK